MRSSWVRNVLGAALLALAATGFAQAQKDLPCAGLVPAHSGSSSFIRRGDVYVDFDVNAPGVIDTRASGINDLGQITGHYSDETTTHAWACRRGSTTNNVGLVGVAQSGSSAANKANNRGAIVGRFNPTETDLSLPGTRGFLLDGTRLVTISVPADVGGQTEAEDINNAGLVTGTYMLADNSSSTRGFLWKDGRFLELGINVPGAESLGTTVRGINKHGDIVGFYDAGGGKMNGFQRSATGAWTTRPVPEGADAILLTDINDNRQITGTVVTFATLTSDGFVLSSISGKPQPVTFPGAPITLPTSLNNNGVIVGSYLLGIAASETGLKSILRR